MIRHINPTDVGVPNGYTHVVETRGARTAYISGRWPRTPRATSSAKAISKSRPGRCFRTWRWCWPPLGATFGDIAKTTTYVLDMSQIKILREIRAGHFGATPPANTLIEVRRLAHPGYLIEIEAVVVLDE